MSTIEKIAENGSLKAVWRIVGVVTLPLLAFVGSQSWSMLEKIERANDAMVAQVAEVRSQVMTFTEIAGERMTLLSASVQQERARMTLLEQRLMRYEDVVLGRQGNGNGTR